MSEALILQLIKLAADEAIAVLTSVKAANTLDDAIAALRASAAKTPQDYLKDAGVTGPVPGVPIPPTTPPAGVPPVNP